jgi:hypothetical protein
MQQDALYKEKNNDIQNTRWYQKVPEQLLLLTPSVKEVERGDQGHTSESLLHQSAT